MIVLSAGCASLAQLMRADQGAQTLSLTAPTPSNRTRSEGRPRLAVCVSPARQTR